MSISERLAGLLLWLLEQLEYDVAAEVIAKPWHWADVAEAHEAAPSQSLEQILASLRDAG